MKTRFLDSRNCHALMPRAGRLALAQRLEACLGEINADDGPLQGSIDELIRRNESTQHLSAGSERLKLFRSPIDISQFGDVESGWINTRAEARPFPGPAYVHTVQKYGEHLQWKTLIPLQFLLKGPDGAEQTQLGQYFVESDGELISRMVGFVGTGAPT